MCNYHGIKGDGSTFDPFFVHQGQTHLRYLLGVTSDKGANINRATKKLVH